MDASVTFSEATAPVKLPTRHCPSVLLRLEPKTTKGGISRTTPPRLASQLQSLPPILHMTVPNPIPGYSKAPQGLFVLPQVARVFTGTVISPSPPSRQWPSRSTIHAGRNLPDKGLRYLRHVVTHQFLHWSLPSYRGKVRMRELTGPVISAGLYMSPHRSDHIFPLVPTGVWRMVSEDSEEVHSGPWTDQNFFSKVFPADCPHRTHCHLLVQIKPAGSAGYSGFPAYSQILQRP